MKRSPLRCTGRIARKTTTEADKAYDVFMAQFRGLPCVRCGRTWFLRKENGDKILSAGHHILTRGSHPQHKLEKNNVIPMCGECHDKAHMAGGFDELDHWLHDNDPVRWKWIREHNHHRKGER